MTGISAKYRKRGRRRRYRCLETGEEIPADGHLLEAISLQINESTLTGEPIISKTTNEADFDTEATYPSNVVMRGTTVVDGHGVMQVEKWVMLPDTVRSTKARKSRAM